MENILFVLKRRNTSYGVSVGLNNSAKFIANFLNLSYDKYHAKVVEVFDSNEIDKHLHGFKPKFCFLEALFVPPYKLHELAIKYKDTLFVVRIHSKTPFLAMEGIAIEWMNEYLNLGLENVLLSGNNKYFYNDMRFIYGQDDWVYLPNIYYPIANRTEKIGPKISKGMYGDLDIGCFGAIRPLKNTLNQAVAAIIFAERMGKKLNFHINDDRVEQRGESVLRNLENLFSDVFRHELIKHSWSDHYDFLKTIKDMDITMTCSFSESYCITAADSIYMNVPTVASPEVTFIPSYLTAEPTNTQQIVDKLEWAHSIPKTFNWLCRNGLKKENKRNKGIWQEFLKGSDDESEV